MRVLLFLLAALLSTGAAAEPGIFAKDNLVAWCIVPFDAKKRGPEERAEMLEKLGLHHFAYDYRAQHIPTWDAEMEALKKHHIELTAWWFPGVLNEEAKNALALFQRHGVHPQLWVTGGGGPTKDAADQEARVNSEAARIRTIAEAATPLGLKVGLYNHGGWFGEPENQLAILGRLESQGVKNVGLCYNLHHGHGDMARFPELLAKMKPHLLAFNLNGMFRDGDKIGKGTAVIGTGELDEMWMRALIASGWTGPVGILNESSEDAEVRLRANMEGLEKLEARVKNWDATNFTILKKEEILLPVPLPFPKTTNDAEIRPNGDRNFDAKILGTKPGLTPPKN